MILDIYLRPSKCETCGHTPEGFWGNITHNLSPMAHEAGLYQAMWRPEEIGAEVAEDLIPALEKGLALLKEDPVRFVPFNPNNGWGNYENLVEFVDRFLEACRTFPKASIRVSK